MECVGCGADLDPTDVACRYCRRATPYAAQKHAEDRAREARDAAERQWLAARRQATAREELEMLSKRAFVFGLAGVVTCLGGILGIFSIVYYARARKLARSLGVDVPAHATAGFAISVLWFVASPLFIVLGRLAR